MKVRYRTKYSYDNAGNALTFGTVTNTYYNSGRMKTAKVGSSTTTYVYNALGQRVKKSGGSAGTVLYAYDESGHLLGEYSSTGALVQETIWLEDTPVATIRPGSPAVIYYVHADQLNAPRMATRPSDNKIAWRWDTDPFGTSTPNQNPQSLGTFVYNQRFPGQMFDSETSINYNYLRDYDSQVGRYIESDPIGLAGGINTYIYTLDNPIVLTDSLGLLSRDACAALKRIIDYDNTHTKIRTLWAYGTLNFSNDMLALDAAFPSIGGPVSIDWMMRSGGYGATSIPPMSLLSYSFGKQLWNLMSGTGPYTNISSPANLNAPTALTAWLYGGKSLEKMFGPALQECKSNCGGN